jgi:serine/threonine protein kinase
LLGVGSFGKVYKGALNDGTIIVVKLLNLGDERAKKSFDKECKVLSRVRCRNLIRAITCYSDLQIKVLIFPLMPNGSLKKWLYPDDGEQSGLSLIQRLNIAIDIAQGMTYLHHHCFVQVIHCDLKTNNVLIGEDMTAYLIDFGISTISILHIKGISRLDHQRLAHAVLRIKGRGRLDHQRLAHAVEGSNNKERSQTQGANRGRNIHKEKSDNTRKGQSTLKHQEAA